MSSSCTTKQKLLSVFEKYLRQKFRFFKNRTHPGFLYPEKSTVHKQTTRQTNIKQ